MTRKDTIISVARDHAKRGIFDNAVCRSGIEKVVYLDAWQDESTGKIHPDLELFE